MGEVNYPSEQILNSSKLQRKDYDHIILWILVNNESYELGELD